MRYEVNCQIKYETSKSAKSYILITYNIKRYEVIESTTLILQETKYD